MGYSRENQRQNEALQSILDGDAPEKRIMVGYQGDTIGLTETEKEERKISSEKADVLKEARMPWFCPECNKIMKSRLDTKFYYLQSRCHDCVVKEETKMRINGTYEEYEEIKKHPVIGAQMLEGIEFLQREVRIIRAHHVHFDGSCQGRQLRRSCRTRPSTQTCP